MSQHREFSLSESISTPSSRPVFYLTNVSYNEEKHEVLVEFSSSFTRVVKRERFFPFFFASGIAKDSLSSLLLELGFKGFAVEEHKLNQDLLCVKALSFSDLKKMSNSLGVHLKKMPIVLSPERAFLIEKNWSYFDSFEIIDNFIYKLGFEKFSSHPPDLGFFLTKEIPFAEALRISADDALFIVSSAAWSNLLKVPMNSVPKSNEERAEIFMENIFFTHGELLSFDAQKNVHSNKGFEPLASGTSKLDFSLVWAELFSSAFFNLGPETRNCPCCKPLVLEEKNILPSSLIRVRFNEDNFFFESCSESFSVDYHYLSKFKDERKSKKREFFLETYPVGPFFKDDSALIPLFDARRLIADGRARLVSSRDTHVPTAAPQNDSIPVQEPHELSWFCKNKESFFSKEVRRASNELFILRKNLDSFEQNLFLSDNFSFHYNAALFASLSTLLSRLPLQLTSQNSKFFSTTLAKSIISVQEATLAKFKEFSSQNGSRVIHASSSSAFVSTSSPLKLAKEFAKQTNLPQPIIAGFK